MTNRRHALVGLATLVATAGMTVYIIGGLGGSAGSGYPVGVTFDRVGQLLRVSGDVKLRGVLVGKVARIQHTTDGKARITLTIEPQQHIPALVGASVRGKTLFGEKFIELVDPTKPDGRFLKAGDQIPESRTVAPFELEQVIQSLIPVLDAAQPGDLGGALHALAQGLAGQEDEARRAIGNTLLLLQTLNQHRGDIDRLLAGSADSSAALAGAAPDIVAALEALDRLNTTLVGRSADLRSVLQDAPRWLDVAAQIVRDRYADLVDLSLKGADILDILAAHRGDLPFAVASLKSFTQDWDVNLSTPCLDASGLTVAQKHPSLAGSTCWQVWILTAEKNKVPGGYTGGTGPTPSSVAVEAAFREQLRQFLALQFGMRPSDLAVILGDALRNGRGMIPEALL
jgi:virulence factor Mce-like protein